MKLALERHTSVLSRRPGPNHLEDLDRAGGVQAVLKELVEAGLADPEVLTVTGKRLGENLANAVILDQEVIRPIEKAHSPVGGIAILRGSLAPDGAVVKQSAVNRKMLKNTGIARVFDSEEQAVEAILGSKNQIGRYSGHPVRRPSRRSRECGKC